MPTIIDSLLVRLGYSIDSKNLEGFAALTETAKASMLAFGAAVTGAVYGLDRLVRGAAERMGGIWNFSEQMGINARTVAALGKVADENDSSLENMEGALRSMTSMAGQAAMGVGRGAMLFKRFGISVKDAGGNVKTTEQLIGDVADRLQSLPSMAQKQALGSRLGFDPATIELLSRGRAEFNRLREDALKAIPFAEEDFELADKTEKTYHKAGASVTQLKNRLAVGLMPTVNELLKKFTAWTKDENNVRKLKDAIQKVVEVVAFLAQNLGKIAAVMTVVMSYKAGAYFIGLATNILKSAKALGSLNFLMGGLRTILTGGILGLILLMAEDLWVFYHGGVSVTGWMLQKFPQAVEYMKATLATLGGAFVALATGSGPLGLLVVALGGFTIAALDFVDSWRPVFQWFGEQWDALVDGVKESVNAIMAPLTWLAEKLGAAKGWGQFEIKGPQGTAKTRAGQAGTNDKVESYFRNLEAKNKALGQGRGYGVLADMPDSMMTWGRGMVDKSTITNTTNVGGITITGVSDPKAAAKAAIDELGKRTARAEAAKDGARARTRNAQGAAGL